MLPRGHLTTDSTSGRRFALRVPGGVRPPQSRRHCAPRLTVGERYIRRSFEALLSDGGDVQSSSSDSNFICPIYIFVG